MEKNMARIIDYQVQNIVGNNIKKYRLEQGMSQKELSDRLETYAIYICRGSISRIESHERTVTDFELRAMAHILKVPIEGYVLGSVLDHVLLHQSVIGLESKVALDKYGVTPDIVIGCCGGGSNFGGLIAPFMAERLEGKSDVRFIGIEPASCPSLTRGKYAYDFCDTGKMTPLARMYTLGSGFMPSPNHAGGLRYHGMSPVISKLYHDGYIEARSVEQSKVFEAATLFARTEGTFPAPESSHAIRAAIDEALKCKESGESKNILFGLTGTGYFDMAAYMAYNDGKMSDYIPTDDELAKGFATLPDIEQNR